MRKNSIVKTNFSGYNPIVITQQLTDNNGVVRCNNRLYPDSVPHIYGRFFANFFLSVLIAMELSR